MFKPTRIIPDEMLKPTLVIWNDRITLAISDVEDIEYVYFSHSNEFSNNRSYKKTELNFKCRNADMIAEFYQAFCSGEKFSVSSSFGSVDLDATVEDVELGIDYANISICW